MDGKPTHEVLARLGRIDHLTPAQKQEMVRVLARLAGVEPPPMPAVPAAPIEATMGDLVLGETRGYGDLVAIESAWRALGLDDLCGRLARDRGFDFHLERAVFAMVANRLSAPRSKYGTADWLFRDVYLPTGKPLDADYLYEALTWLAEVQPEVELALYRQLVDTGRVDATAIFYDTTTTWFEGLDPERLAARGRDKGSDPPNRRLLSIGLIRSLNGWPIVHRVFPGSMPVAPLFHPCFRLDAPPPCRALAGRRSVSPRVREDPDQVPYGDSRVVSVRRGVRERETVRSENVRSHIVRD